MLSEPEKSKLTRIIDECWQGEQVSEADDIELEYELFNGNFDSLFFDTEDGRISLCRHFQYDDDPEYDPLINDEEYWRENAFSEFMEKHTERRICTWHDLSYDMGYPGTDYERYVGFTNVPCTEIVIKEYLNLIEIFDEKIVTLQDAIQFLCQNYLKYSNINRINFHFDKSLEIPNLDGLEVSYEGTDYYFCRSKGQVYVCDLSDYKQIDSLFSRCTLYYKKGIADGNLWFTSSCFSLSIDMTSADSSYLEVEQYFLNSKLQRNMLAMDQLYGDNAPNKTEDELVKERQLAKAVSTACAKLIQNSLYKNQPENIRNDALRDFLSMAGYDVKDQTRTGYSASGISVGEADLMIVEANIPFSFIEALNLGGIDAAYIKEHIDRVYKYDRVGVSTNFIVCYVNVKNPVKFTHSYKQLIISVANNLRVVEFVSDTKEILENTIANVKIIKMSFVRNGIITSLYHILAFFDA